MSDSDGTDYCGYCQRVTESRTERGPGYAAFICVVCGNQTDVAHDDEDDEDICDRCREYLSDCDCDDEDED